MKKWEKIKKNHLEKELSKECFVRNNIFYYWKPVSLEKILQILKLKKKTLEQVLKKLSYNENIDWKKPLEESTMQNLLLELELEFEQKKFKNFYEFLQFFGYPHEKEQIKKKSLVVTIMGHVDHGKTTLLDVLRNSDIAHKEHGQITQKVGGYQIQFKNKNITFIDTPGHELFSEMRKRGSQITDLIILVVAANEGIKQQTIEAIKHAQNAKVPIIVFINKMDLKTKNPENIIRQLKKYNLIDHKLNGGNTHYVKGSCLQKKGIQELLETLLEKSKKINLDSDWNLLPKAVIVDSYIDKQGIKTAIIVQSGILKIKQAIIVDDVAGKIRDINDDLNTHPKEAKPGQCVVILGLNKLVHAGSILWGFPSEKLVNNLSKKITSSNPEIEKEKNAEQKLIIDAFMEGQTEKAKINLIIKVDSKSTEEIFKEKLKQWKTEKSNKNNIELNFIMINFGEISEKDINFAKTTKSQIFVFNIKISKKRKKQLEEKKIKYQSFYLLHKLFEALEEIKNPKEENKKEEIIIAKSKIIKVFKHSKLGNIAGCFVEKGSFKLNNDRIKIIRNGETIGENLKIKSLKQEQKTIQSINENQEFGIILFNFNNFEINDELYQYQLKEN